MEIIIIHLFLQFFYHYKIYHFVINSYFMKFITSTELNFEWKYIGFSKPNQTNQPTPPPTKKKKESRLVGNNAKILVPVKKKIPCVIKWNWNYKHRFLNNRLWKNHWTLWLTVFQIGPCHFTINLQSQLYCYNKCKLIINVHV